jgi:hypothetical protein
MDLAVDQAGMTSQETMKGEKMTRVQGVSRARFIQIHLASILVGAVLIGLKGMSAAATSANAGEVGPAFIIPLFPQKERDLKKGLPSGMTEYSFWAGRGTMALTKLDDSKVQIAFDFDGLIPYGVYTLWNVLETEPFKDEPLGEFGYGKHSVVADGTGKAQKVVVLDKWPGKEFLLDYHADGQLSQSKGVYPGALWGRFPPEPKR